MIKVLQNYLVQPVEKIYFKLDFSLIKHIQVEYKFDFARYIGHASQRKVF